VAEKPDLNDAAAEYVGRLVAVEVTATEVELLRQHRAWLQSAVGDIDPKVRRMLAVRTLELVDLQAQAAGEKPAEQEPSQVETAQSFLV
jgi:hypothetical protein